jgi:indole-3-glycerol phosphate synthase
LQPKAPQSPDDAGSAGFGLDELKRLALARPVPRGGLEALRGDRVAVVAEIDADRADRCLLAEQYEHCGAGAIAVPAGHLAHLGELAARTETPVISLEPATSGYGLWLARAHGAALALVPAAQLPDEALVCLVERAESIGTAALVEVRDGRDLVRALRARARALLLRPPLGAGPATARTALHDLLTMVPDRVVRVAECGPAGHSDLIACARLGADAVLVGGELLAGRDPGPTVARLASIGAHPALSRSR